jgi:serine/threonine protein kinase
LSLEPGARLGPYEIAAPLGAGGRGAVYRARDPRLGREVAIEVLPPEMASDPDRLRRFEQEARAASALNHPHILTVHDIGIDVGTSYFVTELLEGESFRELLRKGPLPPKRAVELARPIARGLAAAHEKGIVHRDLKPENLFLESDGVVKILDFGSARLAPAADSASQLARAPTVEALTGDGAILGTVGYMAPEQVRGEAADARADLFAFGCVLYELRAGGRAFRRESAVDTLHAILHDEPPELAALGSTTPSALDDLLRHGLDRRREQRFQSAGDLLYTLDHLESTPALAQPPWSRRRALGRRPIAVALVLLLSGAIVGLVSWSRKDRAEPPTRNFDRIAVLPFEISAANREALSPIADKLAQALISELSRLPGLRVTPWATARRYADTELSSAKLAEELGIEALLSIALQPEAGTMKADLALVEGESGLQVWGEQVSARQGDPVTLRSLITRAAARSLRPQLSEKLATEASRPVSANPEAYQLALRAAALLEVPSRESLEAAESLLRRALTLDPNLALAKRARGELEFDRYYYGWDGDLRNLNWPNSSSNRQSKRSRTIRGRTKD